MSRIERWITRWSSSGRFAPAPLPGGDAEPARGPAPDAGRALFVDLEGALVRPLVDADPEGLQVVDGAAAALAGIERRGWPVVVIARQARRGRIALTRTQMAGVRSALAQRLLTLSGVRLLDVVVCPHPSGAGGRPACLCHLPAPGLLQRAARSHRLDLAACWLVGDSVDAVEAGRRGGCRTLRLAAEPERTAPDESPSPLRRPDAVVASWDAVADALPAAGVPRPATAFASASRALAAPLGSAAPAA